MSSKSNRFAMPSPCIQVTRRLCAVIFALSVLAGVSFLPAGDAMAADQAANGNATSANKAEIDHLVAAIEDPVARQKLVADLKLLVAADKAGQDNEEPSLLGMISEKVQEVSDDILAAATVVTDVGRMGDWLVRQFSDARLRGLWADILSKMAAIMGGGLVAEYLAKFALRSPRRWLEHRQTANRWLRLPLVGGRWLLGLLPIAVFILAVFALRSVPLLTQTGDAQQATLTVNTAYVLSRFLLVLIQAVLMPGSATIRLLPLGDETATYLFIWARRLTLTGVWGYFLVQALKLLGLPKSGYGFSLKVLGLVLATLLVILVLQNRQAVGAWIRSRGANSGLSRSIQGLRDRLADVWHILASLYIIASFVIWALQVKGGFDFIVRASLLTLFILVIANVLAGFLARLVERAFSIAEDLKQQFPELELRANRYLAIMHNMVRVVVVIITLLALAQAWGANTLAWLTSDLGRQLISSVVSIVAVLIGALILWELVNASIERYLVRTDAEGNAIERGARARTLLPLLRNVVMVVLIVVVTLIVLSELGVNIAPLLAGAGVVGVAIGFGSQKLVQDVITGAFILFENTIAVGEVVKIGDHTGSVEGMTIRTLRLRDATGQVHTVPFSNVATVINLSRDFGYHVFEIGVSYREDIDQVISVIRQLGEEMRQDGDIGFNIIEPMEVFGLDKFTDSAVIVSGRLKTLPGKQWMVGREFNRRLKNRFDALDICIPYPTTTLYFGEDRDGKAPPVHVQMTGDAKAEVATTPASSVTPP
ncbi:mechanosensitive ion channel domain-containing protein [Telmatospirillum sp.]|uniref:mechanosensitive ion channel domain-containing protein n=1 Tax=Telmatospirillum sp. TaxID=2079197 RepID=UPI00284AD5CA|nr:mechanosensitive ion channel domain-containing protein [Telmatospirillum sp.]MDR3439170.1 mechanosensitive ion channel [Telmatospirillum sp.]